MSNVASKALNIPLILASTSPSRRALLTNAGIAFSSMRPHVDERAVEAPFLKTGATPVFLAGLLSRSKALDVSMRARGAFVIGGDQVMAFEESPIRNRKAACKRARISNACPVRPIT
nr:Maf family protein [Marinicella sp. W31]MDC2879378.1 Maf family protein [Marinicella sp. W31]